MHTLRRAALALLAVPALLAAATPARAERPSPIAWPGAEVVAGQSVDLAWDAPPAGVEEIEILLSLDDGRSFPLRVTPELDARERHYRWRVPDLPTARARLRMRVGAETGEAETAPTASFRIAGVRGRTPAQPVFREGTFWTGLMPLAGTPGTGISPVCHFDSRAGAQTAAESSPRESLERAAPVAASPPGGAARAASFPRATAVAHRPRLAPLRI